MTSGNSTSSALAEDLYRTRASALSSFTRSATARSSRLRRALSRGVRPYFLALDLSAAAVAVPLMGSWDRLDAILVAVCLVLFGLGGAYKSRLTLSILQDGGRLATRAVVAGAFVVSAGALLGGGPHGELVRTTLGLAVGVLLTRTLGYAVVRECRARGLVTHRAIVLGAGQVGAQIFDLLVAHPEYGLRPVGFIDANPLLAEHQLPAPLLGGDEELARLIVEHQVEDVIVAFGRLPGHRLVEVIRTCDRLECEIFFVP
ncbi:MAG: nucleoside-diphosphate sugar epimerase/dehydratase, partial [Mycobacteriales bacterium]